MARAPLKIAHVLNMANNGYHMVKALRKNGVEADLIIDSSDFGMGNPIWEEKEIQEDPYSIPFEQLIKKHGIPPYVKIWHNPSIKKETIHKPRLPKLLSQFIRYIYRFYLFVPDLYKMVQNYDILHLHPPSPIFLFPLQKTKIIHEAGWIRTLATQNTPIEKMGRRAYETAESVVWTNPDTHPLLAHLNIKQLEFVPFVIDPERYKPVNAEKNEELLFFHPARQVWDVKGNDKLLKAFAKFIHAGYKAKLRLIDWGFKEDVQLARILISQEDIEDYVEWHPPYSKPNLIKAYNESDAVFDQFILGSGGTTCFESMSCETPLVIHLNHWNKKCFGEMPPAINASTIEEIYIAMVDLTDSKYRRTIGREERKFTLRHNHPDIVAKQLIKIYEGVEK